MHMCIVLFKKEVPGLSCAKKKYFTRFYFIGFTVVPTTMPALTMTPEGT